MQRLVDITFHANHEYTDTDKLLQAQQSSLLYIQVLQPGMEVLVVKHIHSAANTQIISRKGIHFFKKRNGFFCISWKAIRFTAATKPDIVLVQGLIFPFQLLLLKILGAGKARFFVNHQAEHPGSLFRQLWQWLADFCVTGYFFASPGNAQEWVEKGIISGWDKVFYVPATLTAFVPQDKEESVRRLNMQSGLHFLWVGRLNANKDPLTVIRAFQCLCKQHDAIFLHMIYQTEELLPRIHEMLDADEKLKNRIQLVGSVPHAELPVWFSAADIYINASHHEGGCTALLEAMACGCTPMVSAIPASIEATKTGSIGACFQPGDDGGLAAAMQQYITGEKQINPGAVKAWFNLTYSLTAIGGKMRSAFGMGG
jgi:glycosyltransferase involved in cell wall biosynthesis